MRTGLYYLAVPYNGTDEQKAFRKELSLKAAAELLNQGIHAFAPVIYVNQIAETLGIATVEQRQNTIMTHLFRYLKVSKGMIVITADGWKDSWGVRQELLYCQVHQIPLCAISPDQLNGDLAKTLSEGFASNQLEQLMEAA